MGIESGPSSYSRQSERMQLPLRDDVIKAAIVDPEQSKALYSWDKVIWLRGAIAVDLGRDPSEILNAELTARYIEGGKFEWDPAVAKAVRKYLRYNGFL